MNRLDISLLNTLPLFDGLADDSVRDILENAESGRFEEATTVFNEGQDATQFYLVLDGIVRIVRATNSGEQVTALHIPPGEIFGNAAAMQHDQYPATATTASEVVVLSWPRGQWDTFARSYPQFAKAHYKVVGKRIHELTSRIVDTTTARVDARVARGLMRLMQQTGKPKDDGIDIGFPITRRDVSEFTGTTTHTVSRLLSAWERDGIVSGKRKKITIVDPVRLSQLCDD